MEPLLLEAQTLIEVEQILLASEDKKIKLKFQTSNLFFTKEEKDGKSYFIQRKENAMYGHVFYDGTWIKSYPHLNNIKDGTILSIESSILEEKLNGTNIGICKVNTFTGPISIVRTRMTPFPTEFPIPTFWNSTINGMINKEISKKLLSLREEMLTKYPELYIVAGDGEYVGLKVQEVVNHILNVKQIQNTYHDYMFFFELIGKINPIIVDSEVEFGLYDFDYEMVLIDIYDNIHNKFVDREHKEEIASVLKLEIVPIMFSFSTIEELQKSITSIKETATLHKLEGYVLKNGSETIKVKPDIILQSAYRLNSIMKGYIYTPDLLNYISKTVTAEHLSKPEEFDNLIELIAEEAKADYSEDIVSKNTNQIRKHVSVTMGILVADKILKSHKFISNDELFRYLNINIPIHFAPLKSYIDYELEKNTEDKEIRERMKNRRKHFFGQIANYCLRHL